MSKMTQKYKGFSLIEILVVVGLIAVLAAVTILALNPARQFANTRNSARAADINTILNAVSQYLTEDGNTVTTLGTAAGVAIPACVDGATPIGAGVDNVDLGAALVSTYLAAIPQDPQNGTADNTGYTICQENSRVTVAAPGAELGATLTVTR